MSDEREKLAREMLYQIVKGERRPIATLQACMPLIDAYAERRVAEAVAKSVNECAEAAYWRIEPHKPSLAVEVHGMLLSHIVVPGAISSAREGGEQS